MNLIKSNKNKFVYIVLILIIIFLSVGYSSFTSMIVINDISAQVRIDADIRITGISVDSSTSSAVSNYEEYNVDSISTEIDLPNSDSSITYKVSVTNFESVEMAILNISGLPDNLKYEFVDNSYALKEKICDSNNKCNLGITKDIYITISYDTNGYISGNTNYSVDLNFDFRKFYKISYVDITNNDYPVEIIDGGTLQVDFDLPINTGIKITMKGNTLSSSDYTFVNKTKLTISNVNGDIVITKIPSFAETLIANNNISIDCPDVDGNYAVITGAETNSMFCSLPDIYGTSYYFRGTTTNNYVKFANNYWRIIRINGNNTVRLIYAGATALDNGYDDSSTLYTRAGIGYYNDTMKDNCTLGYMYGTSGATSYSKTHTNTNDSTIKKAIDSWYVSKNLANYEDYLADAYFCNDRSLYKDEYYTKFGLAKVTSTDDIGGIGTNNADTTLGYGTQKTYYGGFYRFVRSEDSKEYPTLMCEKNDTFTKDDTVNGNGALKYPIATITADELVLAGAVYHHSSANNSFYMYNGYRIWTMTPSFMLGYAGGFNLYATGWMTGAGTIASNMGYRPVINISADAFVSTGDGKKDTPYQLSISE